MAPLPDSSDSLLQPAVLAGPQDLTLSPAERAILRRLAGEVAELAARPQEQEKIALWKQHNQLRPTRPLVFCDPENGWNEIIPPEALECAGPLARDWERRLRQEIFWGREMQDDRVIEPIFDVPHVHTEPDWGLRETRIAAARGGAYRWEAPVRGWDDLERMHAPILRIDYAATQRQLELAAGLFGDLLEVRNRTLWFWTTGLTQTAAYLRGLEQLMLDMADAPELVDALMTRLRDGTLQMIEALEAAGLFSLNNDGTYVGSGGFGWTDELPQPDFAGHTRTQDLWALSESQETVGISPRMFERFIFPHQSILMQRFGLICYGCCEPVDSRWRILQRIPNLRRVSVSPWANLERMAENLGEHYIFSWKPNPAALAADVFDEEAIRIDLQRGIEIARDCRLEIIMKDNHTIRNDPRRVTRWVQLVRAASEAARG